MQAKSFDSLLVAAGAIVLAALMFGVGPALAQSEPGTAPIICTGTDTTHYAPPLGPLPQETVTTQISQLGTFADEENVCVGPVTGGHWQSTRTDSVSCLVPDPEENLPSPSGFEFTIFWSNGNFSTIEVIASQVISAGGVTTVTSIGTVTDGLNEGAHATITREKHNIDYVQCVATGIHTREGKMTVVIG